MVEVEKGGRAWRSEKEREEEEVGKRKGAGCMAEGRR